MSPFQLLHTTLILWPSGFDSPSLLFSVGLLTFFMPQGFQSLLPFQVLPNHLVTNLCRSRYHLVEKEHDSGEGSHFGQLPIITEFGSNQEEHQVVQPKTSLIPISGEGSHLSGGSEDRAPAAMARAITVHVDTMKVALTILVKRSPWKHICRWCTSPKSESWRHQELTMWNQQEKLGALVQRVVPFCGDLWEICSCNSFCLWFVFLQLGIIFITQLLLWQKST